MGCFVNSVNSLLSLCIYFFTLVFGFLLVELGWVGFMCYDCIGLCRNVCTYGWVMGRGGGGG